MHLAPQKLHATSDQIAALLRHARNTSEGSHPTFGNHVADVLDCLVAVIWSDDEEDKASAAEDLVDAASALRDRADIEMQEAA